MVWEIKPDGDILEYEYDFAGNKTKLIKTVQTDNGPVTTTENYTYDDLNRLETATDAQGNASYTYDAVGNRQTLTYLNGNVTEYVYDSLNRLTEQSTRDASNTLILQYLYTLGDTGRRTRVEELNGRATSYQYDNLYRLTQETVTDPVNGNYSASFQYDAVGNRTQSIIDGVIASYSYDLNDRLLSAGSATYTYDNNGNTLTKTENGQTVTYSYDPRNRLVSVTDGQSVVTYEYNVDGIRTGKIENGITTRFVVDQNRDYAQVVTEITNGAVEVQYLYGDDLIAQDRSGNISYYLYDGLGSTRALSDGTGSLTNTYHYDAFGVELARTGSTENNYLFTGEQFDSSLGFYYLRARYLNPNTGRFHTMDTFEGIEKDPVSLHKYLYANADPVNFTDPSGKFGLGSFSVSNAIRGVLSTVRFAGRSAINFLRVGRVNGVRVQVSLRTRLWLTRTVNRVQSRLPKELGKGKLSKDMKGWRWTSKKHQVRVQKGNPKAQFESQRVDYVQLRVDGKVIGRNGNPLPNKNMPEAHIPLSEWKVWVRWDLPF